MKKVDTYTATIYVGLREGYTERMHNINELISICQQFCDAEGFCVTVSGTEFIYTNGREIGATIGIINYPRFPHTPTEIKKKAIRLALLLKNKAKQKRVSIVLTDETIMLDAV